MGRDLANMQSSKPVNFQVVNRYRALSEEARFKGRLAPIVGTQRSFYRLRAPDAINFPGLCSVPIEGW
jgi:hypothetical protein